jgi:hypothetical protein
MQTSKELVAVDYRPPFAHYVIEFGDGREAFLTVREDSHPLQVWSGSATGVLASEDVFATVDEASVWLLSKIRNAGA